MFCLQFTGHSLKERYCRRTIIAIVLLLALETDKLETDKLSEGCGIFQGMAQESFSVQFVPLSLV